jgi:beta-phosphoglucomutase-like phosphatase (HAD superfamily)
MKKQGVIFDLDGTVVETSYDWRRIREEIGAGETSILTHLESLAEPERSRKKLILEKHEAAQTKTAVLREGVRDFLGVLRERRVAIRASTSWPDWMPGSPPFSFFPMSPKGTPASRSRSSPT